MLWDVSSPCPCPTRLSCPPSPGGGVQPASHCPVPPVLPMPQAGTEQPEGTAGALLRAVGEGSPFPGHLGLTVTCVWETRSQWAADAPGGPGLSRGLMKACLSLGPADGGSQTLPSSSRCGGACLLWNVPSGAQMLATTTETPPAPPEPPPGRGKTAGSGRDTTGSICGLVLTQRS